MGNLGPGELVVILIVALIFLGPKKLPDVGKSIGKALREFNKARSDFMETINSEVYTDTASPRPADWSAGDAPAGSVSTYPADGPGSRPIEYPRPLGAEPVDASPYGGDFYAVGGDSQPSFRTASSEQSPAAPAASVSVAESPSTAAVGERKV